MNEQPSIVDFYTELVLPGLAERLDTAFPEFGWQRDARGWIATNDEMTRRALGVRANRVIAHGPAPRGEEFVRVVKDLAGRAGIDVGPIEQGVPRDGRADLLHDFFELCRRELSSEAGVEAQAYLERRGFSEDVIEGSGIGLVPATHRTKAALRDGEYTEAEIAAAGVVADSRWSGRICGAWRTEHGRIGTLWARTLDSDASAETRYLYLRGASRTNLPPYGLSEVLAGPRDARRELVLVEGFIDFHQLRARGFENVAALGGTSSNSRTFERLSKLGVEAVTVCLDNDEAGRAATTRAVDNSTRAQKSPAVYVVSPDRLGDAKDPDSFVQRQGTNAWLELLTTRECGIGWRARQLVTNVEPDGPLADRREALRGAGEWLGSLPARLSLEQEDAVGVISERCGYSADAVERAFRARYWRQAPQSELDAEGRAVSGLTPDI